MVNIFNMSDTWNNGATVFTAILMNVSNGAGGAPVFAANSKFLDLQSNGVSVFNVDPSGLIVCGQNIAMAPGATITTQVGGGSLFLAVNSIAQIVQIGSGFMNLGGAFGIGPSNTPGSADVLFFRDAANTLALRNSTNPQIFNIYNTFTNASNYERLSIQWSSNVSYLRNQNAGTGVARLLSPVVGVTTVASLPAAATAGAGAVLAVTDSLAPAVGVTVVGGGGVYCIVSSDGVQWKA